MKYHYQNDGQIVVHESYDREGGIEQSRFEWIGPKYGATHISGRMLRDFASPPSGLDTIGKTILVGPYRLRCIEYYIESDTYVFVRSNSLIGNVRALLYRYSRWLDLGYRRLILTAAVWRLAECPQGRMPSWRDLHVAQKFLK